MDKHINTRPLKWSRARFGDLLPSRAKEQFDDCSVDQLFQPDVLITRQYFDELRSSRLGSIERLMLAVLRDAIDCLQRYLGARDVKGRKALSEAEQWIWERDADGVFSFVNICEVLGYHPAYLRRGLRLWKEQQIATKAVVGRRLRLRRPSARRSTRIPPSLRFKRVSSGT
jgi:hypothetical protein